MSVPYIGAKISLTSRSLIRYEGILASVDPKEATISLERVRMMGTEGRRPGQEIPASNDVYDAVVFRSNDIEDLQIFEPPASVTTIQQSPARSFVDPAIVSSKTGTTFATKHVENEGISAGGWPIAPRLQFGTATSTPIGTLGQTAPSVPAMSVPAFGTFSDSKSITSWNAPKSNPVVESPRSKPTFGSFTTTAKSAEIPSTIPAKPNLVTPSILTKSMSMIDADKKDSNNSDKVIAYNTGTGKMELVGRQTRSYASVVSDGAGRFRVTGERASRLVPRSEYDFERANALLRREAVPETPKTAFYDKSASFFDNISCESANGNDSKLAKNERKWNIETFGVAAPADQHRNSYHHHHGPKKGTYYHHHDRSGARGNHYVEHQSR